MTFAAVVKTDAAAKSVTLPMWIGRLIFSTGRLMASDSILDFRRPVATMEPLIIPNGSPPMSPTRRTRKHTARRAMAVVELAVCMPILTLLVLGTVETANLISVQQGVTAAAYEAIRIASSQGGTPEQAESQAEAVLASYGIEGATIEFTPTINDELERGEEVTVRISAPASSNSVTMGSLFGNRTVHASLTMVRL